MLKMFVVGNVGRVDEVRTVGENEVLNFSLAVTTGYGEYKKTVWFQCALWNRAGVYPYITVGMPLALEVELQPDEYGNPQAYLTDDGEPRSSYRVRVKELNFVSSAEEGEGQTETPRVEEHNDIPF